MQLMNIQNELNIEVNGENLKIENHVDAVERLQKEKANSKVEDYISLINNNTETTNNNFSQSNIYNPAPVQQNLMSSNDLANKQR